MYAADAMRGAQTALSLGLATQRRGASVAIDPLAPNGMRRIRRPKGPGVAGAFSMSEPKRNASMECEVIEIRELGRVVTDPVNIDIRRPKRRVEDLGRGGV